MASSILSTHRRTRQACLSGTATPPACIDAHAFNTRSGLPGDRAVGGFYGHVASVFFLTLPETATDRNT